MPDITTRPLSSGDLHDFRSIRLEALQRAPDAFGSVHEIEVVRPLQAFEDRLRGSLVVGAYHGGQIVGMAGLAFDARPKDKHKGALWGMYVRPEVQRRGVGAALIEAVIGHTPEGIEQVTLGLVKGNEAAHALYRRFGFVEYGVEPRALKTPDGYVDEILMIKFLEGSPGNSEQAGPLRSRL